MFGEQESTPSVVTQLVHRVAKRTKPLPINLVKGYFYQER